MFSKKYYLFLICLQLASCSSIRLHTNSRLSGFVLVDNNFSYVEELVPNQIDIAASPDGGNVPERLQDAYNPNERDVVTPAKANVRFEPSVLYFKDKVVGNSYRETVYIYNTSQNKTLRMEKIAGGKHSQIQIAAFGDELVTPGGNTTFDIMFIGKDLMPLSTHYYIYTSKGILKYDVVSWCLENPYRITPMSLITLPLNSSYSHSITLRNPFPEPLQILEALLHGGDYTSHTLPSSTDLENAADSWTIQPYETKEILKVHFQTYEAWNLTTFQSIKLGTGTTLLIPVDVEVMPRTGLYVPGAKIDFESGGHLDPPAVRPLHLCSSAKKTVTIESVACESRVDGCEVVDFRPTALPPWSCAMNPVAKVKFVWSRKLPGEITNGGLLIKNDLDPFFRVNYTARVHHGGLTYNSSLTHYVTGISSFNSSPRPFAFKNEYRELVAVMNVYLSFEAAEYFHIRGFEPSVLRPLEKRVLFNLQTRKGVKLNELKLDSSILLETNISTIRLPLRVYDGLLTKLSKVAPSSVHLGLVSAKSAVITYFGLSNTNPETIFVKYFGCNDSAVRIELLDVKAGNAKTFYYRSFLNSESGILHAGGFNIHPHHYASFKLSVNTSDTEEEVYAEVWVQSEYQRLAFPMYMNVAKGFIRVSPDPFEFEDCFPGAYCIQQLTVESHFMRSMSIINISTIPYTSYDKLLFYPNMPAVIAGHSTSIVGNILWEPSIDSSQAWPLGYLGLPNNRTGRDRWLGTIERPNITRDFDLTLMESQYLRYREQYSSPIDLTFRMDTTEMRNFLFKGRIQLQWPQIVTSRVIDFPLVQIGTVSYENVSVFNPMHSHYMTVQAIMAHHYQQEVPTVVGTMISEYEEPGGVESKSNEFFLDTGINSPYKCSVLSGTKRKFTNHRSSVVFVLPPQANTTIRIGFVPCSQTLTTTRLYLRNDFTILDSVAINGAGAYPQLTLEGLENSAGNLIKFVIPYETLKLCEESNNRVLNITTKKVFRLRNTGQVSVHIFGFTINGLPCQGYGFKITNCHNTPFVLKPGMSKRIEISFTPDFTSARVESNLLVESDIKMGPMLSYTLYAALDSDWLRKCKPHLQRPYWEPLVYYLMIGMFFFLLIGVAIMAVYEVSTNTSRLINSFGGVEPKMQAFYDLKLIEMFFVRSSVPHHHHHNHHHHHHRTSTALSQSPSVVTVVKQQPQTAYTTAVSKENGSIPNGHVTLERDPLSRTNSNASSGAEKNVSVAALTVAATSTTTITSLPAPVPAASPSAALLTNAKSAGSASISSSQSLIYNYSSSSSVRTNSSISNNTSGCETTTTTKSVSVVAGASGTNSANDKREKNSSAGQAAQADGQQVQNGSATVVSENTYIEESPPSKSKKGKKYDFEEVCYKSNWFKKKQAKKEDKLTGNKFLKNGWARCLKGSNLRKEAKCAEEKRCSCTEKCAMTTTTTPSPPHTNGGYTSNGSESSSATEAAVATSTPVVPVRKETSMTEFSSSANVSSHSSSNSNSKFINKDVPRKLDFNKLNAKKTSNNSTAAAMCAESPASETTSSMKEAWSTGAEDTSADNSSSSTKITKQKKRKSSSFPVESPVSKFSETTTKENIKENCAYKVKSPTEAGGAAKKVATKDEKGSSPAKQPKESSKSEQSKKVAGADSPSEALKPITNLPKSKEPFETLSSLCNESVVGMKNKRKSNLKKRTKDEKSLNITRELAIVFTTPESVDRKLATANKTTKAKLDKSMKKHDSLPAQQMKNEVRKRNGMIAHRAQRHQQQQQHQQAHASENVDEETRIFDESRINSTTNSYFSNGELYSRVVAPSTSRSSPSSSSSSGSTASYESSGTLSQKIQDNQSSQNIFWDTWNNDMFFQSGIVSSSYRTYDIPVFQQNKHNDTRRTANSTAETPSFVVTPASDQRLAADLFCYQNQSKQEEHDVNSDEADDGEFYKFARNSLSDEEESYPATAAAAPPAPMPMKSPPVSKPPVVNDIWGPPTSLYPWTPSDLSGSPSTLTSDAVSAISLSRLLRFEEKKEKDVEQYGSLSSLWSADTKSLWGHPKQE